MNNKQKLGYTLLGAGIMAVGITIGQFFTPNIEAQSDSVLDELVCRKLTVVDSAGKPAITLDSWDTGQNITNTVRVYQSDSLSVALVLESTNRANSVYINDKGGLSAFDLEAFASQNRLTLWNRLTSEGGRYPAIHLDCVAPTSGDPAENRVFVSNIREHTDRHKYPDVAIGLHSHFEGNEVFVLNSQTGTKKTLEDR